MEIFHGIERAKNKMLEADTNLEKTWQLPEVLYIFNYTTSRRKTALLKLSCFFNQFFFQVSVNPQALVRNNAERSHVPFTQW